MSLLWSQESHGVPIKPRYQDLSSSNRQMLNAPLALCAATGHAAYDIELLSVCTIMCAECKCDTRVLNVDSPPSFSPLGFLPLSHAASCPVLIPG